VFAGSQTSARVREAIEKRLPAILKAMADADAPRMAGIETEPAPFTNVADCPVCGSKEQTHVPGRDCFTSSPREEAQ
jgi:hypothetical protein